MHPRDAEGSTVEAVVECSCYSFARRCSGSIAGEVEVLPGLLFAVAFSSGQLFVVSDAGQLSRRLLSVNEGLWQLKVGPHHVPCEPCQARSGANWPGSSLGLARGSFTWSQRKGKAVREIASHLGQESGVLCLGARCICSTALFTRSEGIIQRKM